MVRTRFLCRCGCGVYSTWNRWDNKWNPFIKGHQNRNKKRSEENKNRIRRSLLGRKQSKETILKRIESRKGYVHNEETKRKIGISNKGKKRAKETIELMKRRDEIRKLSSKKYNFIPRLCACGCGEIVVTYPNTYVRGHSWRGRRHSKDSKLLISKNAVGNKGRSFSAEHRYKIGISNTGKKVGIPLSEIHRDKIRRALSGERCYNWKGGISKEPYSFDWQDKLKQQIKNRDRFHCKGPLCKGKINRLAVHHIDYNKKNCSSSNLITLCVSCNSMANFNRDRWIIIYSDIVQKGGSCESFQ